MRTKIFYFLAVVVIVLVSIVATKYEQDNIMTAGNGGISLQELNDTSKTSVVAIAETNTNTDVSLAQVVTIMNWEHQNHWYFVGAEVVGTASSQFGIMCPTYDVFGGANFNGFRLEGRVGDFTRNNNVKSSGFDPQFMNDCILFGESAAVSNAIQLAYVSNNTKVAIGHQGGDSFYKFNTGNYYVCAEQNIKNVVSLCGGLDFAEKTSGYAAVKLNYKQNSLTVTGNKLGSDQQNCVISYMRDRIQIGKNVNMSLGSAFYLQPEKQGVHLVGGFGKGNVKLFAQAGGYLMENTFTPLFGLGASYKL